MLPSKVLQINGSQKGETERKSHDTCDNALDIPRKKKERIKDTDVLKPPRVY